MSADVFLGKDMGLSTPVYNERLQMTTSLDLITHLAGIVVIGGSQVIDSLNTAHPEKTTFSVRNSILDEYAVKPSSERALLAERREFSTAFTLGGKGKFCGVVATTWRWVSSSRIRGKVPN